MNTKKIIKNLEAFQYNHGLQSVLSDCLRLWSIKVSNAFDIDFKRVKQRLIISREIIKKYTPAELVIIEQSYFDLVELLLPMTKSEKFDDYLGELYMATDSANKKAGQYFTPYQLSQLMAQITIDEDLIKKEIITVNEPTCGSGGSILAFLEELLKKDVNYTSRVLVVAQDIDIRCVNMCYLQLAFAGVPAVVLHGDTLSYHFWDMWITPAFMMQYNKFKNVWDNLSK